MAAPKETASWFPFYCADGRTLTVLEQRFQLQGIGFFTNLMRILCTTPQHHLDLSDEVDRIYMYSKIGCGEELSECIISSMVQTEKLDRRLWEERKIIYCGDLIESLSHLYSKRKASPPTPDELYQRGKRHSDAESDIPNLSDAESGIPDAVGPHMIEQDRIVQDTTTRASEEPSDTWDDFTPAISTDAKPPPQDPVFLAYYNGISKHLIPTTWPNKEKQLKALHEMETMTKKTAPHTPIPDPVQFAAAIIEAFQRRKANGKADYWKAASWEPVTVLRRFGELVTDLSDNHHSAAEDEEKGASLRGMYETNR